MKTLLSKSVQQLSGNDDNLPLNSLYNPLYNSDDVFSKPRLTEASLVQKQSVPKPSFVKRITPFLLLEIFLLGLFPYMLLTGKVLHSMSLTAILFPVIFLNVLFLDFALCNYFEGKKIFMTWSIESLLSGALVYLLI